MTWENLTADADALRGTLGYDKWAVVGHSFGGHVALEYALRYREHVSHLVLLDTAGDAWWPQHNAPEILRKRGYRLSTVEAARRFYNGQLRPADVRPIVMKFLGAYFYHVRSLASPAAVRAGFRLKMRPEAHVFGFGQLLPGWTVMDRAGHNPQDERPAEVIEVIRRFLTTTYDTAGSSHWRREVRTA